MFFEEFFVIFVDLFGCENIRDDCIGMMMIINWGFIVFFGVFFLELG